MSKRKLARLWETRASALSDLNSSLSKEEAVLEKLFWALARVLEDLHRSNASKSLSICALVGAKGRNLAHGCYSLMLDGAGQESGALLRLLLEAIELMRYVRTVPKAVTQVLNGKLPRAGDRAAKINGKFQPLRDYLNEHASHLAFSYESMRHLFDLESGKIRILQPHRTEVLRVNLKQLYFFTHLLAQEANECSVAATELTGQGHASAEANRNKIVQALAEAEDVFDFSDYLPPRRTSEP